MSGFGFQWVPSASGHVPENAVRAGQEASGEPLYVGRADISGSLSVGKVHPSHQCLYVPYGGAEHRINSYEVLVEPLGCE